MPSACCRVSVRKPLNGWRCSCWSATAAALQLLERDRSGGSRLALALGQAMDGVGHCADPRRDDTLLCVVEGPTDVYAVEQTGYRGRYFVLKGHLSPLDGLGPDAIGIPQLMERIAQQGTFTEVILATNPTVEGEATAHYIAQLLNDKGLVASRIAHGVPLGGELDLVDGGTLRGANRLRCDGLKPSTARTTSTTLFIRMETRQQVSEPTRRYRRNNAFGAYEAFEKVPGTAGIDSTVAFSRKQRRKYEQCCNQCREPCQYDCTYSQQISFHPAAYRIDPYIVGH